jgi:hypothetical protein
MPRAAVVRRTTTPRYESWDFTPGAVCIHLVVLFPVVDVRQAICVGMNRTVSCGAFIMLYMLRVMQMHSYNNGQIAGEF